MGNKCGLGCINFYPFYGVGGVAYVNGTEFADDDFIDYEAREETLRMVFTYGVYVVMGMAVGVVVMAMGQFGSYVVERVRRSGGSGSGTTTSCGTSSSSSRRAGTLQEPLLSSDDLANA